MIRSILLHQDLILSAFDDLLHCHNDVRTTMVYAHILNRGGSVVECPADNVPENFGEYYTESR